MHKSNIHSIHICQNVFFVLANPILNARIKASIMTTNIQWTALDKIRKVETITRSSKWSYLMKKTNKQCWACMPKLKFYFKYIHWCAGWMKATLLHYHLF